MGQLVDGVWVREALGAASSDGSFRRSESRFRNWITRDGGPGPTGEGGFPAESGRYHLYVSLACPWAHRTLILRRLKDLVDQISVDVVHPLLGDDGWTFATDFPGATGDRLLGRDFLHQVYTDSDPAASTRVTVPVLWDKVRGTIVSNESADILRMLNSAFAGIANERDFFPASSRDEIEAVNGRVYAGLNNGVYRAGFATRQEAYDTAVAEVFATLDWMEERLGRQRYLVGDAPTEADWRAATTLFRFDPVYNGHFKCNRWRIVDYPNLWGYARDLYQEPGVAGTVDFEHIRLHYYRSHASINPTRIVPVGPVIDWRAPHGRARIAAA